MTRLRQLIHEMHRRSLWQVLLIYMGGSWITLQLVDDETLVQVVLEAPKLYANGAEGERRVTPFPTPPEPETERLKAGNT